MAGGAALGTGAAGLPAADAIGASCHGVAVDGLAVDGAGLAWTPATSFLSAALVRDAAGETGGADTSGSPTLAPSPAAIDNDASELRLEFGVRMKLGGGGGALLAVLLEPNSGSGGLAVGGASVVVACGCAAGPRGVEISGLLVREGLSVIAGGRNEAIGAGDGVLAAESEVRFEAVVTEAGDVSFRSGWFEISLEAGRPVFGVPAVGGGTAGSSGSEGSFLIAINGIGVLEATGEAGAGESGMRFAVKDNLL